MRVVALLGAVSVLGADVSPVEKVIQMFQELQSKVVAEGKAEAATYEKFACFCKDQTKEKTDAINEGESSQGSLTAELESLQAKRDDLDADIVDLQKQLADYRDEVAHVESEGKKRRAKYGLEITDLSGAVKALEGAIDVMKVSDKTQALLSIRSTLQTAAVMAQTLNLRHSRALVQIMQEPNIPEVPVSDYDFHSNSIIDTLKELLAEFRKTKNQVDESEVSAQQAETMELQALHDSIKAAEKTLEAKKSEKNTTEEDIGTVSEDLTIVTATLHDDQNYLKDLTDKCNKKSELWDQRSAMRTDELTALTQALTIISDTVNKKTTDRTVRFTQMKQQTRHAHVRMLNKFDKSEDTRSRFLAARDPRQIVMNMLRAESLKLKSASLAMVAARAGADPLAKVKKLIEELVLRLQEEASQEASHNGWCNKQTKLAEDKRSHNVEKITKLNTSLAKAEVKRDKLKENLAKLEKEVKELEESLKEQTALREEEKTENDETIQEAKDGQTAVLSAIQIMERFYKTAAKSKSLTQQGPTAEDIPDAGFDDNYAGAQDTSVGIIGMLNVIEGDFARTISETEKQEKEQAAAFLEFETTTQSSLAAKNNAHDNYTSELTETEEQLTKENEDLITSIEARDSAITELIDLHAACVDTGMSYEERVARREEEVEALKNAYKILSDYQPS